MQSSNGTFINGTFLLVTFFFYILLDLGARLSDEGKISGLHPLKSGDMLDFGIDIKDDEGKVLYTKVSSIVAIRHESQTQATAPQAKNTATSNVAISIKNQDAEDIMSMLQVCVSTLLHQFILQKIE